jgi:hypothetical protein
MSIGAVGIRDVDLAGRFRFVEARHRLVVAVAGEGELGPVRRVRRFGGFDLDRPGLAGGEVDRVDLRLRPGPLDRDEERRSVR